MRLFLCALAMAFLSISAAEAQQRASLMIVVEDIDKDAAACGFKEDVVQKTAAQTLRKNNIRVVNEADMFLYVNMNVVYQNKQCGVNYDVSLVTFGEEKRYGAFRPRHLPSIHLCDSGGLTLFPKGEPVDDVLLQVSEHIEACLADTQF